MALVWIDIPELQRYGEPFGVGDAVVWPVVSRNSTPEWDFLIDQLHIDWSYCVDETRATAIWGVIRSVKSVWFDWITGKDGLMIPNPDQPVLVDEIDTSPGWDWQALHSTICGYVVELDTKPAS